GPASPTETPRARRRVKHVLGQRAMPVKDVRGPTCKGSRRSVPRVYGRFRWTSVGSLIISAVSDSALSGTAGRLRLPHARAEEKATTRPAAQDREGRLACSAAGGSASSAPCDAADEASCLAASVPAVLQHHRAGV